jgi:hypothetical protein
MSEAQLVREIARLTREITKYEKPAASAIDTARAEQKARLDKAMGLAAPEASASTPWRQTFGAAAPPASNPSRAAASAVHFPTPVAAGRGPSRHAPRVQAQLDSMLANTSVTPSVTETSTRQVFR